jgi:hypothetical protein
MARRRCKHFAWEFVLFIKCFNPNWIAVTVYFMLAMDWMMLIFPWTLTSETTNHEV